MNFDLTGPLPSGTTVIEASAGSGKTYAIVGLATRYVAEGVVDPGQLMLVTFGRAATQELRERTRESFTRVAAALTDPARARRSEDALLVYLATAADDEVEQRRRRLAHALSNFDVMTITTTHSFCQRMLDELGLSGENDSGVRVVESIDDLVDEVIDDLYLREFGPRTAPAPLVSVDRARAVARMAQRDRQARIVPVDAPADSESGQRVAFAAEVREEVQRRKRRAGVRDFDDLLVLLRDALTDPASGLGAARRVSTRYRAVLVDEFQDTDPVQWDILRRAFHGHSVLVLVGDPKQAIYAFRGAEVLSYLEAVSIANHHLGLGTNWRTDRRLVDALDHVYGGAALGHPQIVVPPVRAAQIEVRLEVPTPLRLRCLGRTGVGPLGGSGFPALAALRERVSEDLAVEVVRLLDSRARLTVGPSARPIEPGDIAVLVRKSAHVPFVYAALQQAGLPVVLAGGSSVFETTAATEWLWCLQAMQQPHRSDRVRLAAFTPLFGASAADLDEYRGRAGRTEGPGADGGGADGDVVGWVSDQLRALAAVFLRAGFATVLDRLSSENRLEERLLGQSGGDRRLTDLRHVGQLLSAAAARDSMGLTELTRWLSARIAEPGSASLRDRSRRLETDTAAVQIVTVHSSKGLEFPVVLLPYAWDGARPPHPESLLLHGETGERQLDLGGPGDGGYGARARTAAAEEAGEELRLLYVALTRAMCHVVAWWAPGAHTDGSPLHRLLLGRTDKDPVPAARVRVPEEAATARRLTEWAQPAGSLIAVEAVTPGRPAPSHWLPATEVAVPLSAADFDRSIDRSWRRTSYSAITADAHSGPAGISMTPFGATAGAVLSPVEPEEPEKTDEPVEEIEAVDLVNPVGSGSPATALTVPGGVDLDSPMNDLPSGAAFGTLVHRVLELSDFSAVDLAGELQDRCKEAVAGRSADLDPLALARSLEPVLRTPLAFGALADIARRDRLDELNFELPLAGGDSPAAAAATTLAIVELFRQHVPGEDPVASYADELAVMASDIPLRGFLTGSIDAVVRIPGPAYVVIDYKSNRLGPGRLTTAHYRQGPMAAEMIRAHYPLQALIYSVALHRYLRWRQVDYDPSRHLGGTSYLFLRGMAGPNTPEGAGVFDWRPPTNLVTALSDLLAGR